MPKIGGDLPGLHEIVYQFGRAIGPLNDSATVLDRTVGQLVGDAGWNGDAASAFKGVWDEDAVALGMFANSLKNICGALSTLVNALTELQGQLDDAQDAAARAGVQFTADGDPVPGQALTGKAQVAFKTYEQTVSEIQNHAREARETAKPVLSGTLAILDPDADSDLLNSSGGSNLASLMHDYFYMPTYVQQRKLSKDIASLQAYHASLKKGGGDFTKAERRIERASVRKAIKGLKGDLAAEDAYEAERLKGKWFNTSVADMLHLDDETSRLTRVLDEIPGLDVLAVTVGTWAQVKYDHEHGWGWTHALAVDAGSNLVGVGAEVLAVETGPFAPIIGYAASSLVNEWTHSVPWTEDIHNDGFALGAGVGLVQGVKNAWSNDVVGMGSQIVNSAEHPLSAAKSLWSSVF
jgi:uncharacterized protein YukE